MLITRGPGDFSPVEVESRFNTPRELEVCSSETLLEYILESGFVSGELKPQTEEGLPEKYTIHCVRAGNLSPDLARERWDATDNCIVEGVDDDYELKTTVFNLKKKEGILRKKLQFPKDNPPGPRYYPIDEDQFFRYFGDRLLEEIFEPGKRPELSELALASKDRLINPENLPVRRITPEEHRVITATALLGQVSV